jgi:hypothetical protein
MKKWICSFLLAAIVQQTHCQVLADPAVGQLDITTPSNVPENVNALVLNRVVVLKVPIYNFSQTDALPSGSCKLKIRLGGKYAARSRLYPSGRTAQQLLQLVIGYRAGAN